MVHTIIFIIVVLFLNTTSVFAATTSGIISSPSSANLDVPFNIEIKVSGDPNTSYYLKARIGTDTNSMTKALTNNPVNSSPDDWLSDGDSWSKFPIATTNDAGSWQGSLTIKASSSSVTGDNLLAFRTRKVGTETNINSSTKPLVLLTSTPSPISTPSPSPTPTSSVFQVASIPSSINSDQSFQTKVEISGLTPNTKYYLKGAFYKSGSSNYFGKTKVGSEWIKNGSTYSNQFVFTSDNSGSFNQSIEVMPDSDDSGLSGSGSYLFKVARYTSSGSGPTWSNEQPLSVNVIASSTLKPTSTKTPFPAPTKTPSAAAKKTSSNASIVHPIPELTPEPEVAGESIENKVEVKSEKKSFLNWGFVAAGFLAFAIGGGSFYLVKKELIP